MRRKNNILAFLMTLVLALSIATPAFADEGDGPLDCGTLSFGCKIQSFILGTAQDVIDGSLQGFKTFVVKPDEIINNPTISEFYNNTTDLFTAIVTVIFIYKLLELLITGDPEARGSLKNGLARLVFTFAFAMAFPKFFKWLLTFNNWIVSDLLDNGIDFKQFKLTDDDVANTSLKTTMLMILALILSILFFILLFQMTIRFAELAFAFAFSQLFIASNMSENFNMLPHFWRNIMAIIFTQAVQISLLCIMSNLFANVDIWDPKTIFLAIGFLFITVKTPTIMKEFLYSSGSGKLFGGMGTGAISTIAREVIRKKI
ncbi:conjugal transfer protein TrbL family protein [Priestia megaterium]